MPSLLYQSDLHDDYPGEASDDFDATGFQSDDLKNEILDLLLNNGLAPNVASDRARLFVDGNGLPNYLTPAGLQVGVKGAIPAFFPGISNATATLTSMGSWSIPANEAEVGSVFGLDIWGNGTTSTSTNEALTFTVVLGGTSMATATLGSAWFSNAFSLAFRWRCRAMVICHTTGSGATWTSYLDVVCNAFSNNWLGNNGSQMTGAGFECEASGTTTLSSLQANVLGLSTSWGGVTGGPTLTSQVAVPHRFA